MKAPISNAVPNPYIELLRHALTALGFYLATNGYITNEEWQLYSGVILTAAPSIWAVIAAQRAKRLLQAQQTVAVEKEFEKEHVKTRAEAIETVVAEVQAVLKNGTHK